MEEKEEEKGSKRIGGMYDEEMDEGERERSYQSVHHLQSQVVWVGGACGVEKKRCAAGRPELQRSREIDPTAYFIHWKNMTLTSVSLCGHVRKTDL